MSSSAHSPETPTTGSPGKTPTKEFRRNKGAGYVYVITNRAWPGYCKVGRSSSVAARLRTYQTSSPHRDFVLHYHRWFPDACLAERRFRAASPGHRAHGEWFRIHPDDAANLLDRLANDLRRERVGGAPAQHVRHPAGDRA
ncbi:GIY-YIG nuclease family protein [Aquibium microcysteis]|uniref:GIY-YIG nuclease family protein n=1 Tax=Aquibium microcysteis TaxID=675281 RepID=UPI00165D1A77